MNNTDTAYSAAGLATPGFREGIREMGPAWIISAVACGPATLASVCIAGAGYGYEMLWVVLLSAVFGTTTQYMAARIGLMTGKGIVRIAEEKLGPVWAWILAIDGLIVTWIGGVALMAALSGVTAMITGWKTPFLGVGFGGLIWIFMVKGRYPMIETACKIMVVFLVLCFGASIFLADISLTGIAQGLVPKIPEGKDAALMMAAIMGGAVHIAIIGMHTYTVNARGWTVKQMGLARFDTFASMGVAFGLYSCVVFIVSAAVLHPNNITVKTATDAALALSPLLGKAAMWIFLTGIWAAAFSTIIPNYLAATYFIADRMGWETEISDKRFSAALLAGIVVSMAGPFIKGSFFLLLPVMLALGLIGTPFIIGIIIYLLNRKDMKAILPMPLLLNILGILAFSISTVLAVRFILERMGHA